MKAQLHRLPSTDMGTPAVLIVFDDTGKQVGIFTYGEDPWKDNASGVSCVLPGPGQPSVKYMVDFMKFSQENEEAHGRVGKMVGEMVLEFGDTRKVVGDLRVEVGVLKGGVNALLQMGGGPSIDDIAKKNDSKIA